MKDDPTWVGVDLAKGKDTQIIRVPIKSYWSTKTGIWCAATNSYINQHKTLPVEKIIHMEIRPGQSGPVLQFIGGPTGFESAYIEDLHSLTPGSRWYICAGTINSWPQCYVLNDDVLAFLRSQGALSQ